MAVELVPSMPATPRFDSTRTSGLTRPASAMSRIGLLAPTTSWSPGRSAADTARATCSPVVLPGTSSSASTAVTTWC